MAHKLTFDVFNKLLYTSYSITFGGLVIFNVLNIVDVSKHLIPKIRYGFEFIESYFKLVYNDKFISCL